MNGEVIKSFLVGLGFGVDDTSLAKFNKAIASAGVRVAALYAGIQVAAGGILATVANISEGFEQMGYEYRIIAPAINKAILLRNAMLAAYRAAGINIVKAVQESVRFNFSLAKTKFALDAIYKSVGLKFLPLLTKQMDIFRSKIYANMPRIQAGLEKFVKFVFAAFNATVLLGERVWSILGRVYDFFVQLDEKTNGWSTIVLAVVAAWKLLNLEFLATPLGMIIAGLVAILALYDDFKTQQEGGESLFDWTGAIPAINMVKSAFQALYDIIDNVFERIGDVAVAINAAFKGDWAGALSNLGDAFSIGGGPQTPNPAYFNQGSFATAPLGSQGIGAGVNQNQTNQTTVNVSTSDPGAAASQVVGAQKNVNADASRNLKSRAR